MAQDQIQLVTFHLGKEYYGIDIQYVKEIYNDETVRAIPNTPDYLEGIINLRGDVVPIVNLHKRFRIEQVETEKAENALNGFIIIKIEEILIGIMIDSVEKVVLYRREQIQPAPQIISGIKGKYIQGVIYENDSYLILLDVVNLFNPSELMKQIQKDNPSSK